VAGRPSPMLHPVPLLEVAPRLVSRALGVKVPALVVRTELHAQVPMPTLLFMLSHPALVGRTDLQVPKISSSPLLPLPPAAMVVRAEPHALPPALPPVLEPLKALRPWSVTAPWEPLRRQQELGTGGSMWKSSPARCCLILGKTGK